MIQRAAEAYTSTTEKLLQSVIALTPVVSPTPTAPAEAPAPLQSLEQRIDQVYDRSSTVRAKQVAVTERHRMAEAAKEEAWKGTKDVAFKVWRVQSTNPCSFCLALDGTRMEVGVPFFRKGETMFDVAGKARLLDYDDVFHPPAHISCRCILVSA
jgi:hypothetical protein